MGTVRDFFRYMKASRRYGQGNRQLCREDFGAAQDTLLEVLRLLGPDEPRNLYGPWVSIRFSALRDLACCAAHRSDVALARSSIEDALALWEASRMGPASRITGLPEWMAWAREYLARSSSGDVH